MAVEDIRVLVIFMLLLCIQGAIGHFIVLRLFKKKEAHKDTVRSQKLTETSGYQKRPLAYHQSKHCQAQGANNSCYG